MSANSNYREISLNPNDDQRFRNLLRPSHWDSKQFKQVLLASAQIDVFPYTTPESIHLGGFRKVIDDLKKITQKTGNECGRVLLVNIKTNQLLAGKICKGDNKSCVIKTSIPKSGLACLKLIVSIHIHPNEFIGLGFSPEDNISFLTENQLIATLINCGDTELLLIKTASTPNNYKREQVEKQILQIIKDYITKNSTLLDFIRLQKEICLENGLSLFISTEANRDLAKKVNLID